MSNQFQAKVCLQSIPEPDGMGYISYNGELAGKPKQGTCWAEVGSLEPGDYEGVINVSDAGDVQFSPIQPGQPQPTVKK